MQDSVAAKRRREQWSVQTRLISSGLSFVPRRLPASTCSTGIISFPAASAAASVEFVSPYSAMRIS